MTPTALRLRRPCHQSWEAMPGMADGRYCATCDRVVVDLTVPEASLLPRLAEVHERLSADPTARVCARVLVDPRGRVLGPARRLLTGALAGLFAAAASGCGTSAAPTPTTPDQPARRLHPGQAHSPKVTAPQPPDFGVEIDLEDPNPSHFRSAGEVAIDPSEMSDPLPVLHWQEDHGKIPMMFHAPKGSG